MKVLKGTLTFVLGMIIGIILFVVAIGGTVVVLATQMTVGGIQKSFIGTDIISPESEIYNKTVLDAVKGVISDVQGFDRLSLKTLYEHYGIELLNGISGIDFTDKEFYSTPIPRLIDDLSIVVNSFTLRDISKIAGVDFEEYGLPILNKNLDNSVSKAIDAILGSFNGDLSIRAIKDNFNIDLGVGDNELLAALQDINLSGFGSVIDVLRVSILLDVDTDTFVPSAGGKYYVGADRYEEVSSTDLANADYSAPIGVETYLAGAKNNAMDMRELRYVKETETNGAGASADKYVVDNSCYAEGFNASTTDKTFYRHVLYEETASTDGDLYVMSYANRVDTVDNTGYTLVQKGFIPLSDTLEDDGLIWGFLGAVDKDSALEELDAASADSYRRVYEGTSIALLQKIAYMTIGELQDADSLLDGLTVGDVIEVDEGSAKIMKSLVARKCKILELGDVAGDLPIGEIIEIEPSGYVQNANGKYVRFVEEGAYTLVDENTPSELTRYKKNSDGTFSEAANGKFVHPVYYTLYNPADSTHAGLARYDRIETEGASSQVLQRFAGATLDSFSTAFDNLMLADVMEIDADVYAVASSQYIQAHPEERFFYYDRQSHLYRVANEQFRIDNPNKTYYHVTVSGESTSFLKKLAYVQVNEMSDAMESVIDDMMISEILDIYSVSALELASPAETSFADNGEYFLEYVESEKYCGVDEGGKYVYAYDDRGAYVKSNFIYSPLSESDVTTETIRYSYKSFAALLDELGGNLPAYFSRQAMLAACGNLYCYDSEAQEYKHNVVLGIYMLNHTDDGGNSYTDKVFFREKVNADAADGVTVFEGKMQVLKADVEEPSYGLYVKDDFLGFIRYNSENPVFADTQIGTFQKSTALTENGLEFYVLNDEVSFYAAVLSDKGYAVNKNIRYERRRCETVYVLDAAGAYVYVDGQYVDYDEQNHGSNVERFSRKLGYIAVGNETYIDDASGKVTEFNPQRITDYIRQKSAPVLRMLARGTLGEMTDIIENAKVSDVIEAESGSLFAIDDVQNAKISELGKVFSSILSDMTVGDLISWSNVKDVDVHVKNALSEVTIDRLLHSLEYNETQGTLVVNMLKLYGYNE